MFMSDPILLNSCLEETCVVWDTAPFDQIPNRLWCCLGMCHSVQYTVYIILPTMIGAVNNDSDFGCEEAEGNGRNSTGMHALCKNRLPCPAPKRQPCPALPHGNWQNPMQRDKDEPKNVANVILTLFIPVQLCNQPLGLLVELSDFSVGGTFVIKTRWQIIKKLQCQWKVNYCLLVPTMTAAGVLESCRLRR